MPVAVLVPFLLACLAPLLARRMRRGSSWVHATVVAGVCAWFAWQVPAVLGGARPEFARSWVPAYGVDLAFALDGLSLLFALLVTGLGALVLLYAEGYLGPKRELGRFLTTLLAFMGAMLGLVLADDLLLLFVFWEGTSITSYLLIGTKHAAPEARASARRALLVTGAGGLALLVGLLLLADVGGTTRLSELAGQGEAIRASAQYPWILGLVLAGAFTKSAQVPFHFWLPGAMAAPTPVSAYLHSATMVKAGVYLLARLHPELGGTTAWHVTLGTVGAVSMVLGAVMAYGSRDLKAILAYTTVNGLGTLVLLLGIGTEAALEAAMLFLLVHALYKGALFMVAGIVDHATGTRDVEQLRGLRRSLPLTAACAACAALSMAGTPPLAGFVAKELAYEAKLGAPFAPWLPTLLGVAANAFLFASAVLVGAVPFLRRLGPEAREDSPVHHPPGVKLQLGAFVLAALGLVVGVLPGPTVAPLVERALEVTLAAETEIELALWHGFNPVLMLSVLTIAAGLALFALRGRLLRWFGGLARLGAVGPARAYEAGLRGLVALAAWTARTSQHGLLRVHVAVSVAVALALAGAPLVAEALALPGVLGVAPRAHEVLLVASVLAACVAGTRARTRLGAVLTLGVVGLATALLFLGWGAPDLALTQVAVESLVVLVFVLVLRAFPSPGSVGAAVPRRSSWRLVRGGLALAGGLVMGLATYRMLALPQDRALADWFLAASLPQAKGGNVVNVILVDFRALDTLGEVTVLALSSLGVTALASTLLHGRQDALDAPADDVRGEEVAP